MLNKKNIFVIIGSASQHSANQKLMDSLAKMMRKKFRFIPCDDLKTLPHFDPVLSLSNPPEQIMKLRKGIEDADAVIICTPEYIYSIPSGLKNLMEWCIATTVFSNKPTGLITASASGEKAHEELQLIMKTAMAKITDETSILIKGVKAKIDEKGLINDTITLERLKSFADSFISLV